MIEEEWLYAERELRVEHDYDTAERHLERLGMRISRLPLEVGAIWRLCLPRGEVVEAWEPATDGLMPPAEIASLVEGVIAGYELLPSPPVSTDAGVVRLREMIQAQRQALLVHDPGARLGDDPENLHEHRVAARRTRAFLRAARSYVDPVWRRSLVGSLRQLGAATSPVRDLDVVLEHVQDELRGLDEADRAAGETLVARLQLERESARRSLLSTLESDGYRALVSRLRLPPMLAPGVEAVPLKRIARKEFARLAKAVDRLGMQPDAGEIHRLRIRLKRARYAAELSTPDRQATRRFLADARRMQNLLGEHQDAVVAEERLRAATVIDAYTAAAFVAGRIAERQRVRRARITGQLPEAWKRLRKSGRRLG